MKNLLLILLITIPVISYGQTSDDVNTLLQEISNEINKSCPMVIDQYTTLTSTYGGMGRVIYRFTIDRNLFTDYEISKSEWLELQTQIMTNTFCTDPSMKTYRDLDIDVTWKYADSYGISLGNIKLNSGDCY